MKKQVSKKQELLNILDKKISMLETILKLEKENRIECESLEKKDGFYGLLITAAQKDIDYLGGMMPFDDSDWIGIEILGFKITKTQRTKNDKTYDEWKAYKTIASKQYVIHLGTYPHFAETKIINWLNKNPKVKEALEKMAKE